MPMPPTSSEIDATAASRSAMIRLLLCGGFGDLTQVAHREIGGIARLDAVAALQRVGDLPDRRLHGIGTYSLQVDLVDETGQPRLQPVRDWATADIPS